MSGILEKFCWGRAIGIYLCANRITVTDVGNTIHGTSILNQKSFEIGDKDSSQFLTAILQDYAKNYGGKNVPVILGLKPEQTFFITAKIEIEHQEKLRDKLLENAGFRSGEERNSVVVDFFKINKIKMHAGQLWSIGICKREIAWQLYNAVVQAGFKNVYLKPTPWCMSSVHIAQVPKKAKQWKTLIHIFLNESGGLAVLVVEKNPICWKRFSFTEAESVEKIESIVRSLFVQNAITFSHTKIDGIVMEGPQSEVLAHKLYESTGFDFVVIDSPGLDDIQNSYALALSALNKESIDFDIFRELRGKPSIIKMFPLKQAVAVVLMSLVMAFVMWQKSSSLAADYKNIKKQNAEHKWALNKKTRELAKDRQVLMTENEAIEKFLKTRILWSDYLRDLPTRLPSNVTLSNIWAMCELESTEKKAGFGRKKVNRALTLKGETLFETGRASPQDIDAFLASLRKVELLQRDFPKIQLGEIKWRRDGKNEVASFTILAAPKKVEKEKE